MVVTATIVMPQYLGYVYDIIYAVWSGTWGGPL